MKQFNDHHIRQSEHDGGGHSTELFCPGDTRCLQDQVISQSDFGDCRPLTFTTWPAVCQRE